MAKKQFVEIIDAKIDVQINGVSVTSSGSLPNVFYKGIDTSDDIVEGTTNLFMTTTQEINFETAYSHSQITTGNPHNLSSFDLTDGDDLFNKATDDMDDILDGTTYVKTQNDFNDTYKDKLDSLIIPTIIDTFDIETKVLDVTDYTTYDNVKYTFFISDGTNMRNGTLYILCNGTTSYLSESSGANVGNTDAVTFDADLSVNDIQLKVISTTTGWTIKLKKEMQW